MTPGDVSSSPRLPHQHRHEHLQRCHSNSLQYAKSAINDLLYTATHNMIGYIIPPHKITICYVPPHKPTSFVPPEYTVCRRKTGIHGCAAVRPPPPRSGKLLINHHIRHQTKSKQPTSWHSKQHTPESYTVHKHQAN